MACAFAKAGQLHAPLFEALALVAQGHMVEFNSQGLANTAWAFAKAGQLHASLFETLAFVAQWHMGEFNAQDPANTA